MTHKQTIYIILKIICLCHHDDNMTHLTAKQFVQEYEIIELVLRQIRLAAVHFYM